MKSTVEFHANLNVPESIYPLDESLNIKYFVVQYVGSSCRIVYSSFDFNVCSDIIAYYKDSHPNNDYHILKLIVNLQKIF